MFSYIRKTNFNFLIAFILSSASSLNTGWSKILLFGKELKCTHVHVKQMAFYSFTK